jgi:hypothetical protein
LSASIAGKRRWQTAAGKRRIIYDTIIVAKGREVKSYLARPVNSVVILPSIAMRFDI